MGTSSFFWSKDPILWIECPLYPKISYLKLPERCPSYLEISGDALKVMCQQNIFEEALKDGYFEFFRSKDPTLCIECPLYLEISYLKLPERYPSYQMISTDALKVMCELNYFGVVIYLRLEYFESKHPIFLIEDPINLEISGDDLKDLYKSFGTLLKSHVKLEINSRLEEIISWSPT